jgi:UDP-GlcNAc:undecaprenyl-phosphate/decaprenyl-phosphate GlcNAc-1-phosphate transferase
MIDLNNIFIYPIIFLLALFISIVVMPLAMHLLIKFDILDHPNHRKIHAKPLPRMAGIVIYISFAIPLLIFFSCTEASSLDSEAWRGIIYGAGIALLIGAADDIWGVPAVIKLISLFLLTLFIWHFGIITNLPLGKCCGLDYEWFNTSINLFITMIWLVGVCSAINALDHMDGLAGGVSIVAAIAYCLVSIQTGQTHWALISLALMGSLWGFLIYNKNPAKVFMGDSGSFFLGFSLASIGILGGWSTEPIKAAIIPIAVLSVPIFDLCYVIIARRLNGTTNSIRESIAYCGKDHIGHRINDLGFSQPLTVILICLISLTISISALTIRLVNFLESLLLFIQIIMVYIILLIFIKVIKRVQKKHKKR